MLRPSYLPFPAGRGIARSTSFVALLAAVGLVLTQPIFAIMPTTTALSVSAATVLAQQPVTLTATVLTTPMANAIPVTQGQVVFCNASDAFCEDLAVVGIAQLTGNGTATLKVLLPNGQHDIYAKFLGTRGAAAYASSTSMPSIATVKVAGQMLSNTLISSSGSTGDYTLSGTVNFGALPGTGTVSFRDVMDNHEIASAPLDSTTLSSTFLEAKVYPDNLSDLNSPGLLEGVAAGDFNNDGIPDLVTADPGDGAILFTAGDPSRPGRFLAAQSSSTSPAGLPGLFWVADFNGDGVLDLAVTMHPALYNLNPATVNIMLGDPAHPGRFLPPQSTGINNVAGRIAVGDLNGDGLPDFVAGLTPIIGQATVRLLYSDRAHPGSFLPTQSLILPDDFPPASEQTRITGTVIADFNQDGIMDLAVTHSSYYMTNEDLITVFLGDPASPGNFLTPTNYLQDVRTELLTLVAGDFNHDGLPDLAGTDIEGGLTVMLANPALPGQFLPPNFYGYDLQTAYSSLAVGDFNGDGLLDLASTFDYDRSYRNGDILSAAVNIYSGDPTHPGQFLPPVLDPISDGYQQYVYDVVAADVNGDGLSDLVVKAYGGASVQLAQRTETAQAMHVTSPANDSVYAYYPGDTNYGYSTSCEISLGSKPGYPTMGAVTLSNITSTTATIKWTSNVPTYGEVEFGTTNNLGSSTEWIPIASTAHSFVLADLEPDTTYTYAAQAIAYFSGCQHWTTSSYGVFKTTAP